MNINHHDLCRRPMFGGGISRLSAGWYSGKVGFATSTCRESPSAQTAIRRKSVVTLANIFLIAQAFLWVSGAVLQAADIQPKTLIIEDFKYVKGEPRFAFLSRSIAELLHVAMIPYRRHVEVIPRERLRVELERSRLPADDKDPTSRIFQPQIYAALGASYVLKGEIFITGESVQINIHLDRRFEKDSPDPSVIPLGPMTFKIDELLTGSHAIATQVFDTIIRDLKQDLKVQRLLVGCFLSSTPATPGKPIGVSADLARYLALRLNALPFIDATAVGNVEKSCGPGYEPAQLAKDSGYDAVLGGNLVLEGNHIVSLSPFILIPELGNSLLTKWEPRLELPTVTASGLPYVAFRNETFEVVRTFLKGALRSDGEWNLTGLDRIREFISPESALDSARHILAKGDTDLAISRLEFILSVKNKVPIKELTLAKIHFELGEANLKKEPFDKSYFHFAESSKQLNILARKGKTDPDVENLFIMAQVKLGEVEALKGRYKESLDFYRNAISHASYHRILNTDAKSLTKTERSTLEILKKAHSRYGDLLIVTDKYDQAENVFLRLRKSDPDVVEYHTGIVVARLRQGKIDSAISVIREGLARWPKSERLQVALRVALEMKIEEARENNDYSTAIRALNEFEKKFTTDSNFFYVRGAFFMRRGLRNEEHIKLPQNGKGPLCILNAIETTQDKKGHADSAGPTVEIRDICRAIQDWDSGLMADETNGRKTKQYAINRLSRIEAMILASHWSKARQDAQAFITNLDRFGHPEKKAAGETAAPPEPSRVRVPGWIEEIGYFLLTVSEILSGDDHDEELKHLEKVLERPPDKSIDWSFDGLREYLSKNQMVGPENRRELLNTITDKVAKRYPPS